MFDYVKIKSLFHLFSGLEPAEEFDNTIWHYVSRATQNIHGRIKAEDLEPKNSISYYAAACANYDYLIDYMRDLKQMEVGFGERDDKALSLARRLVVAYEENCADMLTGRLYES